MRQLKSGLVIFTLIAAILFAACGNVTGAGSGGGSLGGNGGSTTSSQNGDTGGGTGDGNSSSSGNENSGSSSLMFMGFENVVTIENGTDINEITNTIYSLTSDTTLKFKGGINSITLTTVAAAMATNDSVKIALDFSETTGITEWTNKLAGLKTLYAISLPRTVTSVQDDAFKECTNLTAITMSCDISNSFWLPSSSTVVNFYGTIEDWLNGSAVNFYGTIEDWLNWLNGSAVNFGSQPLYLNGKEVSGEVTVPNGITTIRSEAFSKCPNLTKVVLPESVTSIGDDAFADCLSLRDINLTNINDIGNRAFYKCSSLESVDLKNVSSIGYSAFYNCSAIKFIDLKNVQHIEDSAFYKCSSLESIELKNTQTIGDSAFYGCSKLTGVMIPDSVTSIGSYAFYECNSLESITIGANVESIGNEAFTGCFALKELVIADGNTPLTLGHCEYRNRDESLFYTCPLEKVYIGRNTYSSRGDICLFWLGNHNTLTFAEIGNNVTSVNYGTFWGCYGLKSITIPDSVTSIGDEAFLECKELTSVTIPDSVTSIGNDAFYSCTGLTSVTIGTGVASIGDSAFYGCNELTTVYYRGSKEQWQAINIGYSNTPLTNATIIYNETGNSSTGGSTGTETGGTEGSSTGGENSSSTESVVAVYEGTFNYSSEGGDSVTTVLTMTFYADKTWVSHSKVTVEGQEQSMEYDDSKGTYIGNPAQDGEIKMTVTHIYDGASGWEEVTEENTPPGATTTQTLQIIDDTISLTSSTGEETVSLIRK